MNLNASSSLCYKYLLTQPGASAGARRPRPPARGPRVYQPSRQLFSLPVRVMTVISLIVLSGDIQINPGPLQFGCLNCCSAAPKVPLIHDLMNDNSLDVLLLYRKRGLPRTLHSLSYSTLPSRVRRTSCREIYRCRQAVMRRRIRRPVPPVCTRPGAPPRQQVSADDVRTSTVTCRCRYVACHRRARLPAAMDVDGLQFRRRVG